MDISGNSLSDWGQWGLSCFAILVGWPILAILFMLLWIVNGWPVIYTQKRVGKGGRIFTMYKFRTMVCGAEGLKSNYLALNEADGPVFKIKNDPRLTKIGKLFCHSGLDELPQLFNVVMGQMNLMGPRPLPIEEEKLIPKNYREIRSSVKPGIISTWVLKGQHKMTFVNWMEEDIKYIHSRSLKSDIFLFNRSLGFFVTILLKTIVAK